MKGERARPARILQEFGFAYEKQEMNKNEDEE
jgi:hypothetical protein